MSEFFEVDGPMVVSEGNISIRVSSIDGVHLKHDEGAMEHVLAVLVSHGWIVIRAWPFGHPDAIQARQDLLDIVDEGVTGIARVRV